MVTSAGMKISALPIVPNALLTDIIPADQAGVTSQESLQQVFNLFQANLTNKVSCLVATTTALTVTYDNQGDGVGATLTNAGAMVALSIDGVSLSVNDRVLVKDQSSTLQNGIYTVTTVGDAFTNWVMTRASDFDNSPSGEISQGNLIGVSTGTSNASTLWMEVGAGPFTVGSTAIIFSIITLLNSSKLLYSSFANPDTQSNLIVVNITAGQAALAAGGHVTLQASSGSKQYQIVDMWLNMVGTNFSGGGGDRNIQITDGTSVWSIIPAATAQSLTNSTWGTTGLPVPASVSFKQPSAAGASIYLAYEGGAADYTAGSLTVTCLLCRIA